MSELSSNKRNSLIEFYRFFFAMNVVIGHGLFPVDIPFFGPDRISVEFFFVLSGFLFYHSLERYKGMPVSDALITMSISKIKPLLVPTVIGLISNVILNYCTNYTPFKIFRYLWYIPAMMATFLLYTILRVLIKKEKTFWRIVIVICIFATLLRFSGPDVLFFFDYARSASAISLGILFAKIPKIKCRRRELIWILLIPIALATFIIVFWGLAENDRGFEALLDLILYPALIYFTFNVDFSFSPFNYLGGLSFGIYAFQCPARLVYTLGIGNRWTAFLIIIVMAVGEDLIKHFIQHRKIKRNDA